jgi:hypothetical protein
MTNPTTICSIRYANGAERALLSNAASDHYTHRSAQGRSSRVNAATAREVLASFEHACNEGDAILTVIDDAAVLRIRARGV